MQAILPFRFIQLLFPSSKSSVHSPIGSSGRHEGQSSRELHLVFSAGDPFEQFWHGQTCPFFEVVQPAFPLPATELPALQGVPEDSFRGVVVASDMTEPCDWVDSSSGEVTQTASLGSPRPTTPRVDFRLTRSAF